MPFTKITEGKDAGKYRTPTGRAWTLKQLRTYFVTEGWTKPVLTPEQVEKLHQQKKRQKNKA